MKTSEIATEAQPAAPEVPWSENGIDALIWADTELYAELLSPVPPRSADDPAEAELWLGRS